jgi:hypothetical protein
MPTDEPFPEQLHEIWYAWVVKNSRWNNSLRSEYTKFTILWTEIENSTKMIPHGKYYKTQTTGMSVTQSEARHHDTFKTHNMENSQLSVFWI